MSRPRTPSVEGAVRFILAIAAVALLVPRSFGGETSYVVVAGASMGGTLRPGDLAGVRTASVYGPGDVVAFRDRDVGRLVVHRILRQEGDRFFVKGDGNAWIDSYRPSRADIVGRVWLRVPAIGGLLVGIRRPIVATALVGFLFVAFVLRRWTAEALDLPCSVEGGLP